MNTLVTEYTRSGIKAQTVTTTTTFDNLTRCIYVGVPGDLAVTFADGETHVFKSAANGYHPLEAVAIQGGSTTATEILALF